jgi:lactate permease
MLNTRAFLAVPLLMGMGFPPTAAAMITLLFNSTSVAFGAVGTAIVVGIGNSISGSFIASILSILQKFSNL